jgi:hypothetical protein
MVNPNDKISPQRNRNPINVHGVPFIYAVLAISFCVFAYWDGRQISVYETVAQAVVDESNKTIDELLGSLEPVTLRAETQGFWSENDPPGHTTTRISLRFPSCLVCWAEFEDSTGAVQGTRLIYFFSEDVHPETGSRMEPRSVYLSFVPIFYPICGFLLWYGIMQLDRPIIRGVLQWMIGIALIPPLILSMLAAMHYRMCYELIS